MVKPEKFDHLPLVYHFTVPVIPAITILKLTTTKHILKTFEGRITKYSVCRMFEHAFYRQAKPLNSYMVNPPPLYIFFQTPPPTLTFDIIFDNIAPMKYGLNTKVISQGKVISSCLEDYKTTLRAFVMSKSFRYDFEIITISDNKRG